MVIWKDIEGFEGLYSINSNGDIFSKRKKLIMKSFVDHSGFLNISFNKNREPSAHRVHRLAAKAFIKDFDSNRKVEFRDGDKWNVSAENLYQKEKVERGTRQSRYQGKKRGVYKAGQYERYIATITVTGERNPVYIGSFNNKEEAYDAFSEKFQNLNGYKPW